MTLERLSSSASVASPLPLQIEADADRFAVHVDGSRVAFGQSLVQAELSSPEYPVMADAVVRMEAGPDWIDVWTEGIAPVDCRIAGLSIFSPGSTLSLYEIFNLRNRHYTPEIFPELLVGDKVETVTFSNDWQFAPHPSVIAFGKLDRKLVVGCVEANTGFGLEIAVDHYRLLHFRLNLGGAEHGIPLREGESWRSPRIRFIAIETSEPIVAIRRFLSSASNEEELPVRAAEWIRQPLYCTWFDQVFKAGVKVKSELNDQIADAGWDDCTAVLDEHLVREAAKTILREGLPLRTILLDVGWFKQIGQWEVDEAKFPDMRRLVDDLHADGFRVVVWWHWGELDDRAEVDSKYLMGNGWRNRFDKRLFDFSARATQEEYLPSLFYRLFSSDPGCYDFDGVKSDFLADKIHPECPLEDPAWAGEENYFLRVTELFHSTMRRYKADAAHIGASGHPWLAPYIDINRTYDVHSTNPFEHVTRTVMLESTCLGTPVAFDFHPFLENLELFFELVGRLGASVQVGNVLYTQADPMSDPTVADEAYWERLRVGLASI